MSDAQKELTRSLPPSCREAASDDLAGGHIVDTSKIDIERSSKICGGAVVLFFGGCSTVVKTHHGLRMAFIYSNVS